MKIPPSFAIGMLALMLPIWFGAAAAYPEISCSTLKVESNNCDQCFDGGAIKVGDTLGRLTDTWTNMVQVIRLHKGRAGLAKGSEYRWRVHCLEYESY